MEVVDTLVKYGQSYQSKVVASLITDVKFLEQVTEITKPAFFESQANQWIIQEVQDYFNEFRAVPTMEVFKIKVGSVEDKALKQTVIEQLKNVYTQVGADDLAYVKKEYLTFCKNQKVKDALLKSVDLLKAGNYDKIIDTMMAASKVGVESDLGLDYIENFESILEDVKRVEFTVNGSDSYIKFPIISETELILNYISSLNPNPKESNSLYSNLTQKGFGVGLNFISPIDMKNSKFSVNIQCGGGRVNNYSMFNYFQCLDSF